MVVTIKAGESNGAMVRGSARNSVVGRAESLRSTGGGSGCRPRGIERRTIRAGPGRDGGPERTATSRGAGEGGAIWYLPVLEESICISWHLMMSPGCSPGCENWLQRE